jgi:hypothetical protein
MPNLQAATMDFHTYDSKDQDTLLVVRVIAADGNTIVARPGMRATSGLLAGGPSP